MFFHSCIDRKLYLKEYLWLFNWIPVITLVIKIYSSLKTSKIFHWNIERDCIKSWVFPKQRSMNELVYWSFMHLSIVSLHLVGSLLSHWPTYKWISSCYRGLQRDVMSEPLPHTHKPFCEGRRNLVIRSDIPMTSSLELALTFAINYWKGGDPLYHLASTHPVTRKLRVP